MTTNNVRVGFVGTGWTERVQIPMFRLGGLTAQAICSGNPENARRAAANVDIPEIHEDWRGLVASDNVDIVSIVTPPHLHAEIAIAALEAGKHVICEKPTALNMQEAEAMFAAAQAAPDQLAIIDHELRFNPARAQLRQLIREGYVGTVVNAHFDRLGSERLNPNRPWNWHVDAKRGGGLLGALGSHLLDLARWTIGRIDGVSAQLQTAHLTLPTADGSAKRSVSADDHAQLQLSFADGTPGTVTASAITPGGDGMSILVVGNHGALRLDSQDRLWGLQGADLHGGEWQPLPVEPLAAELTDYAQVAHSPFVIGSFYLARRVAAALSAGESIIEEAASFYDGLVVQRLLDAARLSNRERRWVDV